MENNQAATNEPTAVKPADNLTNEVKNFYKGDFKVIFTTMFKEPIDGTLNLFKNPGEKAYLQSMILYGSVFVLYLVGFYILVGDARDYVEFYTFVKIGLAPVILMLFITAISFGIKSASGKPQF